MVCVSRRLLVLHERTHLNAALVLLDADTLRELARHPLEPRLQITAASVAADRSAVCLGTMRGAVMRFALRGDAPTA